MGRSENPAASSLARGGVEPAPRPILKWVGGKTQLLEQMTPLMPKTYRRYFEPFVGGAAVFFDLRARHPEVPAFLSDVNAELVNCYVSVRDSVEAVIAALGTHVYDREHYYAVRAWNPDELEPAERAARTIFLNKTGYNGLYRVNRSGRFNVPFGRFTRPMFCDADNLRACSRALAGVSIKHGDFSTVLRSAKEGDFVYFDPPYVPVSPTSDFTAYVPGGFGADEQRKLAKVFTKLADRGVSVMLSNSDTAFVRELYAGFDIQVVYATRSVNSNASRRGKLAEVVVRSYGKTS
ncbi:MAG TPA: DNA adenine methylase [Labilithrix sp.]|jgi:DNA adenine methylase|nr:DNA adenine methylase [Labilithrix sp.]